jgi:hypothetical protein
MRQRRRAYRGACSLRTVHRGYAADIRAMVVAGLIFVGAVTHAGGPQSGRPVSVWGRIPSLASLLEDKPVVEVAAAYNFLIDYSPAAR